MAERKKQMSRDKISRLVNWGHWFAFFNGFLAMLVGLRYISSVGYPESALGWGYLLLNTIGHFTFLAFIVYLVFIFPVTLLLPYSKILRGLTAVIASLGLYALLYDTLIFDDYGIHLSPFAFDLAWQDLSSLLHSTSYISVPIGILLLELTAANYLWKRIDKIQKKQWGNKVVLFVGGCFIASHLIHIWADATSYTDITRFDNAYPVSYPATAKSFMASNGFEQTQDRLTSKVKKNHNLSYPIKPMQCRAETKGNVLIVAIDSFRADMVTNKTMPFLSQYQQQHISFSNHFTGGNQYASGMFSILYGLQTNYSDQIEFNFTPPVLTQVMKQQGYSLQMFAADDSLDNLAGSALLNDFTIHEINNIAGSAATDHEITQQFSHWQQKQQTQPWLALVSLTTPRDYDTPVGFLGIETIKSPAELKPAQKVLFNQYRQSLYYLDQQLDQLLANLDPNITVIITGTHGQVFNSDPNLARGDFSPANVKVPLIVKRPTPLQETINYRTSHYGIAPTLLSHNLGCINATKEYSSGRSLFQPSSDTWVYIGNSRVFAIYQQDEVTVLNRHGKYQIYNLDFTEQLDKKMSAPELIQVMRESRRFYNH